MLVVQVATVADGIFLLPHVSLTIAHTADALRSQTERGIGSREIVLRQLLAVQTHRSFQRQVANAVGSPDGREQIVVDVLCHTLLQVIDGISGMVANGKVGILIGVGKVVRSVGIINRNHGRRQQGIDKAVGDACRIGRRVEHLFLGRGQSVLLRTAVGGIHAEVQVLLQFPLSIDVEVVTLETRTDDDAVLIGIVGREGVAVLLSATVDAQLVGLLGSRTQYGILPVCTLA